MFTNVHSDGAFSRCWREGEGRRTVSKSRRGPSGRSAGRVCQAKSK